MKLGTAEIPDPIWRRVHIWWEPQFNYSLTS